MSEKMGHIEMAQTLEKDLQLTGIVVRVLRQKYILSLPNPNAIEEHSWRAGNKYLAIRSYCTRTGLPHTDAIDKFALVIPNV